MFAGRAMPIAQAKNSHHGGPFERSGMAQKYSGALDGRRVMRRIRFGTGDQGSSTWSFRPPIRST